MGPMRRAAVSAFLLGPLLACGDSRRSSAPAQTLAVWEQEDAQVAPFSDELFQRFRALPGNEGVKIVRTHYHGEDLRQQFQTASIAGSPPDLIMVPNDVAGIFSISGFILPVDGLFDLL